MKRFGCWIVVEDLLFGVLWGLIVGFFGLNGVGKLMMF